MKFIFFTLNAQTAKYPEDNEYSFTFKVKDDNNKKVSIIIDLENQEEHMDEEYMDKVMDLLKSILQEVNEQNNPTST